MQSNRNEVPATSTDLKPGANTNNQNPQPDQVVNYSVTYPRDPEYYYSDGSGVFLVDGTLFKVQTTLAFGPRPASPTERIGWPKPIYIEDISPRLLNSNDVNPIELPDIPIVQFKNYLLALLGRPYDTEYSTLLTSYHDFNKRNRDLCVRYLDIATLARRFGMIKLEEWAIEALHTVFTGPAESLTRIASEYWETGTLLRLRAFTGVTKLDTPISAFIQYFISINTKETADNDMTAARTNALTCVGLYNSLKGSENDSALLGCVFLNILSLGHRSSIRGSGLTGNDRAILYAAQIELIDMSSEFCSLQWLDSPGSLGRYYLCSDCQAILARRWVGTFKNCKKELGSGSPLKDVTLVAQLPKYRWELLVDMGNKVKPLGCGKMLPDPYDLRRSGVKCTAIPLLSYIDRCIRKVYEEAASRHKKFAEELFQ